MSHSSRFDDLLIQADKSINPTCNLYAEGHAKGLQEAITWGIFRQRSSDGEELAMVGHAFHTPDLQLG